MKKKEKVNENLMNLSYDEKVSLVVRALYEAGIIAPKGENTQLFITSANELTKMLPDDIWAILRKLEKEECVIKLIGIPTDLKSQYDQSTEWLSGNKTYFEIEFTTNFNNWYSQLLLNENSKLENISDESFDAVFMVLNKIEPALEVEQKPEFMFEFINSPREIEGYEISDVTELINYHLTALTYLKNAGIVENFTREGVNAVYSNIKVNIPKFYDMLQRARKLYSTRKDFGQFALPDKPAKKEVPVVEKGSNPNKVYWIDFTPDRHIILNGTFRLGKPNFDSENDVVFNYLYENPNKKHGKQDIEKVIGNKLTKSLHKIIENLGFKASFKSVFFDVSDTAILFRNPITQADLDRMDLKYLKL